MVPFLEQHQQSIDLAITRNLPPYVVETERASLARLQEHLRDVVPDLATLHGDMANLEMQAQTVAGSVMDSASGMNFEHLVPLESQVGENITVKLRRR